MWYPPVFSILIIHSMMLKSVFLLFLHSETDVPALDIWGNEELGYVWDWFESGAA